MTQFRIPNREGLIRQVNTGDSFGTLWASSNIDLISKFGKLKANKLQKLILNNTFLSSERVYAGGFYDDSYFIATDDKIYECDKTTDPTDSANWSENSDSSGSTPKNIGHWSDMTVFGGAVLISGTTDINRLVPNSSFSRNWWTSTISGTALSTTSAVPHMLAVSRGGQPTLFVTDGTNVRYYNSTIGHKTVALSTAHRANVVVTGDNTGAFVGTYSINGGNALVYEIKVGEELLSTPVARGAYEIDGQIALTMQYKNGIPYVVTERGAIQRFNGSSFVTIGEFPFYFGDQQLANVGIGDINLDTTVRPIHPRGSAIIDDSLFIYLRSNNIGGTQPIDERTKSGIWEFNLRSFSLSHFSSLSNYTTQTRVGFVFPVTNASTKFLVSGEVESGTQGLWGLDTTTTPTSYFVTPEIQSDSVVNTWIQALIEMHTLDTGETIKVKYRTERKPNLPIYASIAWADTTTFSTTSSDFQYASVGDEVEVISGTGAGKLAHITAIEASASTYSVTLDTAIGTSGQTSYIRVDNFKEIEATATSADKEYKRIGTSITSSWIQYKVVLTGDVTMRKMLVTGNTKQENK